VNLLTAVRLDRNRVARQCITDKPFGNLWRTRSPHPEVPVPLLDRIRAFLSSPQGRRLSEQGRRYASDPRNQQRARSLLARMRRR
jgi:hypothetical protein